MSHKGEFYTTLSHLVEANASRTLDYLIDEGHRLEREVRERNSRPLVLWPEECALFFEIITDPHAGKVVINPHGTIFWINEELASWMKKTPNEMIGRCFWDISKSGDVAGCQAILARALQTGRMVTTIDRNSRHQPIQGVIIPMPVPDCPCALVLSRVLSHQRVFVEAFGEPAHVIE